MSKLEIFIWCNTAVAIIGTILNAKQIRFGFILWSVTNVIFVINNLVFVKSNAQAALFTVYLGLSIYGYISWGKSAKKTESVTDAS